MSAAAIRNARASVASGATRSSAFPGAETSAIGSRSVAAQDLTRQSAVARRTLGDSAGEVGWDRFRRDRVRLRLHRASMQVSEARSGRAGLIEPKELEILVPVDL
jgi:hypothetical protein